MKYLFQQNYNALRMMVVMSLYVTLILPTSSCHRTKSVTKTSTPEAPVPQVTTPQATQFQKADSKVEAILKQLHNDVISFDEIALKLKTKINSSELNQSFTTNIRWKKNEKIWMSISIIGIEGARVLITKDSIKIMDKINNRYILKPISFISEKALVNLSFNDIESILLGQLIFTDTSAAKYADNATNIAVSADGKRFLTNILFDKTTKNLTSIFVTDKLKSQTIDAKFSDYQQQLGKPFAMDRELKMKTGIRFFEMSAKIQNIELKQNLEYPFPINSSYKIE